MDMYPASETNRLLEAQASEERAIERLLEAEGACEIEQGLYERGDFSRFTIEWEYGEPYAEDEDVEDCYDEVLELRCKVNELNAMLRIERDRRTKSEAKE